MREEVGYFENQVHRMDYPAYRARGWQIGSGPVESACQPVVGQRLKGAGMHWEADGADAVCHLRALFLSDQGQWDGFWNPKAIYKTDAYPKMPAHGVVACSEW
jgi:hypothetical protein